MPRENRNNDISRFHAALQELENGSEEGVPMLNLTFTLDTPGFADGVYRVRAKGFLAAALWWAAAGKALADWSASAEDAPSLRERRIFWSGLSARTFSAGKKPSSRFRKDGAGRRRLISDSSLHSPIRRMLFPGSSPCLLIPSLHLPVC